MYLLQKLWDFEDPSIESYIHYALQQDVHLIRS
jgi:hypothetical protein